MSAVADNTYSLNTNYHRPVGYWLLAVGILVLGMILMGGVTRLSGSGLSVADWKPISATIPPITELDWQREFDRYQIFPEYQQKNFKIDLEQFKSLYWIEYIHGLLDPIIAAVFLGPWVYFSRRFSLPRSVSIKLTALFVLGAAQGLLGWYMTYRGWIDIPRITQYRLTAHLGLAVLIYGSVLWLALRLIRSESRVNPAWRVSPRVSITLFGVLALIFIIVISGGLMAGTGAGLVYNTFPLMAGHWMPPDILELRPIWRNNFENITMIQFQHRTLAMILVIVAIGLVYRRFAEKIPVLPRRLLIVLSSAIGIQFIIGVATLLNRTPVHLSLLHQCWAMVVFSIAVVICALLEPKWRRTG